VRAGHNLLAVLTAVESFDLPYIRFDARVDILMFDLVVRLLPSL
jgi:hypothetical protein